MIERKHTVCFAAAEGGFELDNRLTVFTGNTSECLNEKPLHTFRNIGSGEKIHRVTVFVCALTSGNLGEIGGKLGVFVSSLRYVGGAAL
jgi:hypothetical protein